MLWLPLTILAYLCNAIVGLADKYFLASPVRNPVVYAFYVGVLGLVFLVIAPFVLVLPPLHILIAALASGAVFTVGILVLMRVLAKGDASRVIPTFGSLLPLATFALAFLFLGEELSAGELAAFAVLVLSGAVLASSRNILEVASFRTVFWGGALAALLIAASSVLAKYAFQSPPFLSTFIWTRIGGGIFALGFFAWPGFLGAFREARRTAPPRTDLWVVAVRVLAGIAFLTTHYAIYLNSVTLVNGLKGIEYAFLFVLALVVSRYAPRIVREELTKRLIAVKSAAIGGIVIGLILLVYA